MFSIEKGGEFLKEVTTGRYKVPYFVKASADFERSHPRGSQERCSCLLSNLLTLNLAIWLFLLMTEQ